MHGQIFAIEDTTAAHDQIVANVLTQLQAALRGRGCHLYTGNLVLVPAGMVARPDIAVTCLEPDFRDPKLCAGLMNPTLLVEVLAHSPEHYDHGDKFRFYRSLPSLAEYVLISQWKMDIEYCRRLTEDIWRFREAAQGALRLDGLGAEIPVEEIYRNVQLTARPRNTSHT